MIYSYKNYFTYKMNREIDMDNYSICDSTCTKGGTIIKMSENEMKFCELLNSYIKIMNKDWDEETFSKIFEQNIPRILNKERKTLNVKKPMSMFMFFSFDPIIRQKAYNLLKKDYIKPQAKEIAKIIAIMWKSNKYRTYSPNGEKIDKDGRRFDYKMDKIKKWKDMANEDKKRYNKEIKERCIKFYIYEETNSICKLAYKKFCDENRSYAQKSISKKSISKDIRDKKEIKYEVDCILRKKWESLKDRTSDNPTHKDKFGRFQYMRESNNWIEIAESEEEEKEIYKILEDMDEELEEDSYEDSDEDSDEDTLIELIKNRNFAIPKKRL